MKEGDDNCHVIYRFNTEKGNMERICIGNTTNLSVFLLLREDILKEVQFKIDRTKVHPLVKVDLILKKGAFKKALPTIFSFSVSLRNVKGEV